MLLLIISNPYGLNLKNIVSRWIKIHSVNSYPKTILPHPRKHIIAPCSGNLLNNEDISGYEIEEYVDGGTKATEKGQAFKKYYSENKTFLMNWLKNNGLNDDIVKLNTIRKDLITISDGINNKINNLFSEWKMVYYLTEDEMNLHELVQW